MSNSKLIDYTKLSPNHSGKRKYKINRITPHCVVGQLSAEGIAGCFTSPSRQASCNYGIGHDGRVSLIVEEKNKSWCSSNDDNDQRAVTIECASDKVHPYTMTDAVYKKLIKLCADICQRNGLSKLIWISDKNKALSYNPKEGECLLTVHRWFKNKACPGDWLFNRLGDVAKEVNKILGSNSEKELEKPKEKKPKTKDTSATFKDGDIIRLKPEAKYLNGRAIPQWVLNSTIYYRGETAAGVVFSTQQVGPVTGTIDKSYVIGEPDKKKDNKFKPYLGKVTVSHLNIRNKPSLKGKIIGSINNLGFYQIVKEKDGWGKLEKGGWVSLKYIRR